MIQKIEVLAADVDMTLSSKGSPLPKITIQALKELHDKNVKIFYLSIRQVILMVFVKNLFISSYLGQTQKQRNLSVIK